MTSSPKLSSNSVYSLIREMDEAFKEQMIASSLLDAEVLVAFVLGVSRSELLARADERVERPLLEELQHVFLRRLQHEPIAYILNRREFFGRDFYVDPRVLIPRPETESLVELALMFLEGKEDLRVLDLGTGSGCIGITLALEAPGNAYILSDVSSEALEVAKKNQLDLGMADNVEFVESDMLANIKEKKFDLIVANLPYIPSSEWLTLSRDVADYEPRSALDGGEDGLEYIHPLIHNLDYILAEDGMVLLEIEPSEFTFIQMDLPTYEVEEGRDLHGDLRFAIIRHGKSESIEINE